MSVMFRLVVGLVSVVCVSMFYGSGTEIFLNVGCVSVVCVSSFYGSGTEIYLNVGCISVVCVFDGGVATMGERSDSCSIGAESGKSGSRSLIPSAHLHRRSPPIACQVHRVFFSMTSVKGCS